MPQYFHYTSGTTTLMQQLLTDYPTRSLQLATLPGQQRQAVLELTKEPAVFKTPISYQVWGQSTNAQLRGVVRLEVFKLSPEQRKVWLATVQSLLASPVAGCWGIWWLQDLQDASNVAVMTAWPDETSLQAWQQSSAHQNLATFNDHVAKNMDQLYYHQDFQLN
ncbi:antibiotic biosynthesis monooxygenase [Limosilactobacillus equigenerosi]|uniref:ABM domain-containing protein n=1 Tax=Limosilactobacillus equigenerosi DSM 18793 = JCM 14505 TaxID=1423742 RepID=A0A0R1UTB9_9LACO|nr:antibiotic biosynthesis monooxygenase [Limosilactobacillus equigenerosi]KRL94890.1 hypothetical protein FC21_GL000933 [Limosilactobacillus equigenerosi DSM 18793 = JCM 14505]